MPTLSNPQSVVSFVADTAMPAGVGVLPGASADSCRIPGGGDAGASTILGITMHAVAQGERVALARDGDVRVRVNANSPNVARGAKLKIVATTGRFVVAATNNDYFFLEANEAATSDNIYCSCKITRGFIGA